MFVGIACSTMCDCCRKNNWQHSSGHMLTPVYVCRNGRSNVQGKGAPRFHLF